MWKYDLKHNVEIRSNPKRNAPRYLTEAQCARYATTQLTAASCVVMADEKPSRILVQWKGNQSKRYDNTKEESWLPSVVATNESAVINPSIDLVSVGDHIEYEFIAKKGIQLWRGVIVSTDPDAECRATQIGVARSAVGVTKVSAGTDVDTECRVTTIATASRPVVERRRELQLGPSGGMPASGVSCKGGDAKAVLPVEVRLPS